MAWVAICDRTEWFFGHLIHNRIAFFIGWRANSGADIGVLAVVRWAWPGFTGRVCAFGNQWNYTDIAKHIVCDGNVDQINITRVRYNISPSDIFPNVDARAGGFISIFTVGGFFNRQAWVSGANVVAWIVVRDGAKWLARNLINDWVAFFISRRANGSPDVGILAVIRWGWASFTGGRCAFRNQWDHTHIANDVVCHGNIDQINITGIGDHIGPSHVFANVDGWAVFNRIRIFAVGGFFNGQARVGRTDVVAWIIVGNVAKRFVSCLID